MMGSCLAMIFNNNCNVASQSDYQPGEVFANVCNSLLRFAGYLETIRPKTFRNALSIIAGANYLFVMQHG